MSSPFHPFRCFHILRPNPNKNMVYGVRDPIPELTNHGQPYARVNFIPQSGTFFGLRRNLETFVLWLMADKERWRWKPHLVYKITVYQPPSMLKILSGPLL